MTANDLIIYDTVNVHELEDSGDNITFLPPDSVVPEIMQTVRVVKDKESVLITGDSYISGDRETYIVSSDTEVDLWTV